MNRIIVVALTALVALSQHAQAQRKISPGTSLTTFFAPPYVCPGARECEVPVLVSPPTSGSRCAALFPIEVHVPRGYSNTRLIWVLKQDKSDPGIYMFDPNYGIERLVDNDRQLQPGAPMSSSKWAALDSNSVPLSTIDYLPHVLWSPDAQTRFTPCDVVDPRIVND